MFPITLLLIHAIMACCMAKTPLEGVSPFKKIVFVLFCVFGVTEDASVKEQKYFKKKSINYVFMSSS